MSTTSKKTAAGQILKAGDPVKVNPDGEAVLIGTPRRIAGAVMNGLLEIYEKETKGFSPQASEISNHVRDFLSQKFTKAIMEAEGREHKHTVNALSNLWFDITGEKL